jgi:glycosyltransferase involved in cell wall biosynthesis
VNGLRILLYTNVDSAHAGGVQAVVRSLACGLSRRGHRVSSGWAERSRPDRGRNAGWAEPFHVRQGSARWLHLPTAARLVLRLLRERPQIVNIHFASPSALYFIALAPWLGYRVVVTCHGSDILRPLPGDAPFLAQVIGGADAVTAVSEAIATQLADEGLAPESAPVVIANGVDTRFWHPGPPREASRGDPLLVAVGRLERVKGFDVLIRACAALGQRGCRARLVIVGEGSEQKALAQQAASLGLGGKVQFAGRRSPEEIRAYLHEADLFVLPSRSEGMPLSLLEAMATGTPVVAADVGGVAHTAGNIARLVPPDDPEALAEAVADLLGDPGARAALGERSRARAEAFSVIGAHDAYEALMRDLVRARRA